MTAAIQNLPTPNPQLNAVDFIKNIQGMSIPNREAAAVDALLAGHVPSYMRGFVDVDMSFHDKHSASHSLIVRVLPDHLTIGIDSDRLRMPLSPLAAQKVADAWGCMLPTTKMVASIWMASTKLPPQPWGPPYDASMMSTDRYIRHNGKIEATIQQLHVDSTKLISGHKKDVVVTNQLATRPKQVAIFGWFQPANGQPIQPLYLGHENQYSDYSHGIRLISKQCVLDGQPDDLVRIMKDPILCVGVSSEGPMQIVRQPDP